MSAVLDLIDVVVQSFITWIGSYINLEVVWFGTVTLREFIGFAVASFIGVMFFKAVYSIFIYLFGFVGGAFR